MLTITRISDERTGQAPHHFSCRTCPYQYKIINPHYEKKKFEPKRAEDVLGGADSNASRDKVDVPCPNDKCDSYKAYFAQMQIRSADEPMTSFYTCMKCGRRWQEN
jgi:DNA-directed RNA polymerase III subunit RPC11